jgi:hypothetical protein
MARPHFVPVRLSEAEYAVVAALAQKQGTSVSAVIRAAIRGHYETDVATAEQARVELGPTT